MIMIMMIIIIIMPLCLCCRSSHHSNQLARVFTTDFRYRAVLALEWGNHGAYRLMFTLPRLRTRKAPLSTLLQAWIAEAGWQRAMRHVRESACAADMKPVAFPALIHASSEAGQHKLFCL